MSSNPLRLRFLFSKYTSNTSTQEELEEFWQLMSELSDNDLIDLNLQELWLDENKTPAYKEINTELFYQRLQNRVKDQEVDYENVVRIRRKRFVSYVAAASLIICIAACWWALNHSSSKKGYSVQKMVQNNEGHQQILLPDGTQVVLNKGSHISYPQQFYGDTREVYLIGEAYFDVAHNKDQPFIVHTGKFITKVLGTAFNIEAYENRQAVKVTVERGKVQVQTTDNAQKTLGVLLPGDQLIVEKSQSAYTVRKVVVTDIIAWKTSDLRFEDITFDEAAKILEKHHNIQFEFRNDSLKNCRFTADFTNDNLAHSLDIICTLTNASWQKDGDGRILIQGEGCN